ncbi:MAG: type III polyketide synthase [Burkholderiales bacterium]|nr:type III polyketide synthase [Burkholderiales bacterium]
MQQNTKESTLPSGRDAAAAHAPPGANARILAVGTAVPETTYTQQDVLDCFGNTDRRTSLIFLNNAIERRSLVLPPRSADGTMPEETQAELLDKHAKVGLAVGDRALRMCMESGGLNLQDIRHLCCVTTTGLLTPGFSSLLIHRLGLRRDCARLDVVGMGCNAGVNALSATASWARANPGQLAVMVCIEICSAAYVNESTTETAVVNSLFGDGSAAVAIRAADPEDSGPVLRKFASVVISEALDAMRFDWDQNHGKFKFRLDRDVPYVVGANAPQVIDRLLDGTSLKRRDVAHWVIHSGGKKVIDAVKANLQLTTFDVRHTSSVLRDHGNLSSASFLFSYSRLLQEGRANAGDHGVLMAMGPGSSIETALIQW